MSFWTRMRHWIGSGNRASAGGAAVHVAPGTDGAGVEGLEVGDLEPGVEGTLGPLSKRRRQELALEKLQECYLQIVGLIDSIQKHQETQDQRAAQIAGSMSQVAGTLTDIETSTRGQNDTLVRVVGELSNIGAATSRWEENLAELPRMVDGHREALAQVARQMAAVERRDGDLAAALGSFREAVAVLGDATTASSVAVKDLQRALLESEERNAGLLQEQNRRFVMLFWVTVALAAVTASAAGAALWRLAGVMAP